jgi:hypothetical protein
MKNRVWVGAEAEFLLAFASASKAGAHMEMRTLERKHTAAITVCAPKYSTHDQLSIFIAANESTLMTSEFHARMQTAAHTSANDYTR